MTACRVTFGFYNLNTNPSFARCEREEDVIVFGARKCDIMEDDGHTVQERFELLLLVEMGLTPADVDEYDFYSVECTEVEVPDKFLQNILQDDEDEDDSEDNDSKEG